MVHPCASLSLRLTPIMSKQMLFTCIPAIHISRHLPSDHRLVHHQLTGKPIDRPAIFRLISLIIIEMGKLYVHNLFYLSPNALYCIAPSMLSG